MKSLKAYLWILPLAFGLNACDSDDENELLPAKVQVTTGEAQDVSLTSATLSGEVKTSRNDDAEMGIAYCLENSSNTITYAKATDIEEESGIRYFSITLTGLQPDAGYIYFAYVKDASGKLTEANERKRFQTNSPVELFDCATMQYVAMREATFCWDLPDEDTYNALTDKQLNASFGLAWSTELKDLTPTGTQFRSDTQTVVFKNGKKATAKLGELTPATTYYYCAYINLNGKFYVSSPSSFVTIAENQGTPPSGIQAIDLGLPSGTKWANMNVGATKASEIGLFFAWGETEGYLQDGSDDHVFGWMSYKWCSGARESQKKYCTNGKYGTIDNKTLLDLADDAAYMNWGEKWRMPTDEDMNELITNTTSEWTTQDGTNGYLLTSTTNGNSIFLPAGGCRVSESNYEDGVDCYFWTSSIDQPSPYASRYLRFYVGKVFMASMFRYYGMNIRPVRR